MAPMNDSAREADVPLAVVAAPATRGRPLLAWAIILGLTTFVVWNQNTRPAVGPPLAGRTLASGTHLLQARVAVALKNLTGQADPQLVEQLAAQGTAGLEERLGLVVLAGELQGPAKALETLGELNARVARVIVAGMLAGSALTAVDPSGLRLQRGDLVGILWRLYGDYAREDFDAPSVTE